MLDKPVILIGYSGHSYVVAETALENGLQIIGYSEKEEAEINPLNLDYLGYENQDDFMGWKIEASFILGIGDNKLRQKIANLIEEKNKKVAIIIHKSAMISTTVTIGSGTFVNKNVVVNAFAQIGKNVILNTGCIIEHECVLYDAVHIAPGAVLAGNVEVGERTFIGANAVIKQGITIGKEVLIGAGAVVLNNIPDNSVWVGNPAKRIS